MEDAYTEICQLFKTFMQSPFFGVECVYEDVDADSQVVIPVVEDNLEIVDTGYEAHVNALRVRYQVGKTRGGDKTEMPDLDVNSDLGLACECLPKGLDID